MASSAVRDIYIHSPEANRVATQIVITEASLIAHIMAMRNAGWVVKPPSETELKVPPTQFGFKLLTPNPLKRKKVMHLQSNLDTDTTESIGKTNQIRVRKDMPSFRDPKNIQSDIVSSASDANKGPANLATKVKHNH